MDFFSCFSFKRVIVTLIKTLFGYTIQDLFLLIIVSIASATLRSITTSVFTQVQFLSSVGFVIIVVIMLVAVLLVVAGFIIRIVVAILSGRVRVASIAATLLFGGIGITAAVAARLLSRVRVASVAVRFGRLGCGSKRGLLLTIAISLRTGGAVVRFGLAIGRAVGALLSATVRSRARVVIAVTRAPVSRTLHTPSVVWF